MIRDDAGKPHESYLAFKLFSFKSSFHAGGHQKTKKLQMSIFAVSEHGNETFNNVIRTLFSSHSRSKTESVNSWVMVPSKESLSSHCLLSASHNNLFSIKSLVEDKIKVRCQILTMGQIYKDWFVLRQMILTRTLFFQRTNAVQSFQTAD